MKNNNMKKNLLALILLIMFGIMAYSYINNSRENTVNDVNSNFRESPVTKQTIEKTVSGARRD